MSDCKKCGGPIAFKRTERGKWMPTNPDGSDHWDDCAKARSLGTYGIRRSDPSSLPGIVMPGIATVFYSGKKPPWDIAGVTVGRFRFLSAADDFNYRQAYPQCADILLKPRIPRAKRE